MNTNTHTNMLHIIDNLDTIDFKYKNYNTSLDILKSYVNFIVSLKTKPDTIVVVKRICHILNLFLRTCMIDTKEKSIELNSILKSISCAPPWDEEDVIFDHLNNLCDYLDYYYPNNKAIEDAITEDIQYITLAEEIKKILAL